MRGKTVCSFSGLFYFFLFYPISGCIIANNKLIDINYLLYNVICREVNVLVVYARRLYILFTFKKLLMLDSLINVRPSCLDNYGGYSIVIGVSTNAIVLLEKDNNSYELVEVVRNGKDKNAYVFEAPDEDSFLDALLVLCDALDAGEDVLEIALRGHDISIFDNKIC